MWKYLFNILIQAGGILKKILKKRKEKREKQEKRLAGEDSMAMESSSICFFQFNALFSKPLLLVDVPLSTNQV